MKSKDVHFISIIEKYFILFFFTTLFIVCSGNSYAQLKIYSSCSSLTVCDPSASEAMATITLENVGVNSIDQTFSDIQINTDILFNNNTKSGVVTGIHATKALVQTLTGQTSVILKDPVLSPEGLFSASIVGPITLKGSEKLIITFYFKANCGILSSPIKATDNTRTISSGIRFMSGGNNDTLNETLPVTYSLMFPVLNLVVDPASQVDQGCLNDNLKRQIKLTNSRGAGSIGNFNIKIHYTNVSITKPTGLVLRNGATVITIAPSINADTYVYAVTPAILNSLGLGSSLDAMETIIVEESISIVSCLPEDNALTRTDYSVEWGCANLDKPVCNPNEGNAFSLIDKEQVVPNISSKISNKTRATLCTNFSPGATVRMVIQNNGTSAKDIAVDLSPVISYSGITITRLSIINTTTGSAYPIFPIPVSGTKLKLSFFTDVDGPGGLELLNGGIFFDDLAFGQALTLEAEYVLPMCSSNCSGVNRSISVQAQYYPMCSSVIQTSIADQLSDQETNLEAAATSGPSDMVPGGIAQTFTFSPRIKTVYQLASVTNTNSVRLTLPSGYALASLPNAKYTSTDSTNSRPVSIAQSGQVVTFTGGGSDGTYSVDLVLTVPSITSPSYCSQGYSTLNWAFLLSTSDACSCARNVSCASQEVYNHRSVFSTSCPISSGSSTGPCNKVTTTSFTVERATFGYLQAAPNKVGGTWIDSDITANALKANTLTPNINKKAAYECDDILVTATGTIFNPVNCSQQITRKDIHVRVSYRSLNGIQLFTMKPNSSSFSIPFGGTNSIVPINNPAPTYDMIRNVWIYDFVFKRDSALFNVIPSGPILLTTVFSVKKNPSLPSISRINRFRGTVYVGFFSDNIESYGTYFKIYHPTVTLTESASGTKSNYLCDTKRVLNLSVKGGSAGDDFPLEFRSIAHPNKIKYQLPPYYKYTAGSSFINTIIGQSNTGMSIADPKISGTLNTGLILTWTRNDGNISWPLLDKQAGTYDTKLEFELIPACNTPLNKSYIATTEYSYHDYTNVCIDSKIVTTSNTVDPRAFPKITFISQDQVTKDNCVFLPFSICNSGTVSPNTWVAFAPNSTTKIIDLYEVINNVDTKIATSEGYGTNNNALWAQLGTFNGTHNYKLKVSFSSCIERSESLINAFAGWDCSGYPASPPNFPDSTSFTPNSSTSCGFASGTLKCLHEASLLKIDPMVFESPRAICDSTKFTIMISSQGLAALNAINGIITLPKGVKLKGVRGQFISANAFPDPNNFRVLKPTQLANNSSAWSVDAGSLIPFNGITNSLRFNEYIQLEYTLQPSCDYTIIPPISFVANAKNSCSKLITSAAVLTRIPTMDFESLENLKVSVNAENFTPATSKTPENLTPTVTVSISNTAAFTNSADLKVVAHLPQNVSYNNSVLGIGPASVMATLAGQDIVWICKKGTLAAKSVSTIKFNVHQTGQVCKNSSIFSMDFENVSSDTDPRTPSLFINKRLYEVGCGNYFNGKYFQIMQGNTCFVNSDDANINSVYKNDPPESLTDHTTGSGKWLGAWNPLQDMDCSPNYLDACVSGINNQLIWQKTIPVIPNTWYRFTYWVLLNDFASNWWEGSSQFQFNDGKGVQNSGATTNDAWSKVTTGWNSGNQSSAIISLIYTPRKAGINATFDAFMGIDDIEFHQQCCVPIAVETSLISERVCSTTNTTCKLKALTATCKANICLIDGGKSLEGDNENEPGEVDITVMPTETEEEILSVFPNPFSNTTTVTYQLHKTSLVNMEVLNMFGEKLETIVNSTQTEGQYNYTLGDNEKENNSGIYYLKITIDGIVTQKKIVRIK